MGTAKWSAVTAEGTPSRSGEGLELSCGVGGWYLIGTTCKLFCKGLMWAAIMATLIIYP